MPLVIVLSDIIYISRTVVTLVEIAEIAGYGRQPMNLIGSIRRIHHVPRGRGQASERTTRFDQGSLAAFKSMLF